MKKKHCEAKKKRHQETKQEREDDETMGRQEEMNGEERRSFENMRQD